MSEQATSKILIVDDDEGVTQTFARMLRLEGYQVRTAVSAEKGLAEAESQHPDAIILDLGLPQATGRRHASLVHASGGSVHERVPQPARALFPARTLSNARSRHRSHASAGAAHRGRCRDSVLGSPAAARADGDPLRLHPRR